jgi:hypothetical protein
MAAVLIPVWTPGASLLEIALYGLLSLPAYAAICLLTGASPWSDVKQVWQVIARRATAQRTNRREQQLAASSEFTDERRIDRCELPLNASAAEPCLRGAELAKTQ